MLKRLSATLNGTGTTPSSSSTPGLNHGQLTHSHSNTSLTSIYGTAYGQPQSHEYLHRPQQQQQQRRYSSSSPPTSTPPLSSVGSGNSNSSGSLDQYTGGYPRPAALSTPYSVNGVEVSPSTGYFAQQPYNNGAASSSHLAILPGPGVGKASSATGSISSGNASKTPSPLHSPQIAYSPLLQISTTSAMPMQQQPPTPIDRLALQKSLKALETLLVAIDEYRELNVRLAKVEKRLAKSAKELGATLFSKEELQVQAGGKLNQTSPYYSTVQALGITSTLFDSLAEVDTKFSRHLTKEYDTMNDTCGKSFKKIAKDERAQDDLLESLDAKLKKANYNYDKRVRSSAPGSSGAQSAHEQFVPLLAQLTDDITRSKALHGLNMAGKREAVVKECARSLTILADSEFKRTCENVRKLGVGIGPLLAVQALLGPLNGAKVGAGQEMPNSWPGELPEGDVYRQQQQQHQPTQQGPTSIPSPLTSDGATREPQYRPRTLDDLLPPRAPFSVEEDLSSSGNQNSRPSSRQSNARQPFPNEQDQHVASNNAAKLPPRSISMSYMGADQHGAHPVEKYGNISAGAGGRQGLNSAPVAQRTVSQPVPLTRDNDATVTMRNVQAKPSLDTSFFPDVERNNRSRESSPSYRHSPSARIPALQTPFSHSPSQSGKVGYFGAVNKRQLSGVREEEGSDTVGNDHQQHNVSMPIGFVVDEMSPEHVKRTGVRQQEPKQDAPSSSHSSPSSPNDSPTLSMAGTDILSASRSHNLNESSYATSVSAGSTQITKEHNRIRQSEPALSAANEYDSMYTALDEFGRKRQQQQHNSGAHLERTPSIESTASEQSFVVRMKAKYAQDREARKQAQHGHGGHQSGSGSGSSGSSSGGRPGENSSKRVSSIAQKWEEKYQIQSQHSHTVSNVGGSGNNARPMSTSYGGRPSTQHRSSMPVISTTSVSHPSASGRK